MAGTTAWSLLKTREAKEKEKVREAQIVSRAAEPPKADSKDLQLPIAVPVIIETSFALTPYLDVGQRGERFMNELLPQMRYWLFQDLGLVLPGVRVRGDAPQLRDSQYAIYIHEVPVAIGEAPPDHVFVTDGEPGAALRLEGTPGKHPLSGRAGVWVSEGRLPDLESKGYELVLPDEFIAVHLSQVVKRHAEELLGIQDVQNFLDAMEEQGYGALVKTVVPKLLSVQRLTDILRRLMHEEISIKNMKAILEALAEWAPFESDPVFLTEYVRMNLKRYIAHKFSNGQPVLSVYLLDPQVEQAIQGGITHAASGSKLSLDPEVSQAVLESFRRAFVSSSRVAAPSFSARWRCATSRSACWPSSGRTRWCCPSRSCPPTCGSSRWDACSGRRPHSRRGGAHKAWLSSSRSRRREDRRARRSCRRRWRSSVAARTTTSSCPSRSCPRATGGS